MSAFCLIVVVVLLALSLSDTALGSAGDRSEIYVKCTEHCTWLNCTHGRDEFARRQSVTLWLTRWSCEDECRYECMWIALDWFWQTKRVIPQFHGKWPFVRFFGIQEPASTLFSILNGLVHYAYWRKFKRIVTNDCPMYYVYYGYGIISMNAWVWSTVFHSRDLFFTELMDYLSALLAVICSTFVILVRVCEIRPGWKTLAVAVGCLAFFLNHARYLVFTKFDYGYNMKVAVTVGLVNLMGWVLWSLLKNSKQPYTWKSASVALLVNLVLIFELLDFLFLYVIDAHSIWHLSTVPIHGLWYSFAIDDCKYLKKTATS